MINFRNWLEGFKIDLISEKDNLEEFTMRLIHYEPITHNPKKFKNKEKELLLDIAKEAGYDEYELNICRRLFFEDYYRQIQIKKYNQILKPQLKKSLFRLLKENSLVQI